TISPAGLCTTASCSSMWITCIFRPEKWGQSTLAFETLMCSDPILRHAWGSPLGGPRNGVSMMNLAARWLGACLLAFVMALPAQALALPEGVAEVASVEGITEYRLENGLR